MPWVHYVPLKVDYSDLYDSMFAPSAMLGREHDLSQLADNPSILFPVMAFFVGTPDGKHGHDDVAREIASAGQQWARTHVSFTFLSVSGRSNSYSYCCEMFQWRKEDMAAYSQFRHSWSRSFLMLEAERCFTFMISVSTAVRVDAGRQP